MSTDHHTPFDPAAFLSECARVHEAATPDAWRSDDGTFVHVGDPDEEVYICEALYPTPDSYQTYSNARAIAHYHNTYAALLDVARGLVEHRGFVALAAEHPSMSEANRLQARREVTELDAILAPLARLAAAGGGR